MDGLSPMTLDHYQDWPKGLADIMPGAIRDVCPRPSLIDIAGRKSQPLFLSIGLHGNETSSLTVLQTLARRYEHTAPPRRLMIFLGNVTAIEQGLRHLPGQPDYNRIWAGGNSTEAALCTHVTAQVRAARPIASIDIHNNTGANPLYGCVNTLRPADLALAARFAPVGVYYLTPATTQSMAFSTFCPAITLECGLSDDPQGIVAALDLIDHVMACETVEETPAPLTLYHTVARVLIDPHARLGFGTPGDISFSAGMEDWNFTRRYVGDVWAETKDPRLIRVLNEQDRDRTEDYFRYDQGRLILKRPVIPAMITRDETVIRDDCLCYFMEPVPDAAAQPSMAAIP